MCPLRPSSCWPCYLKLTPGPLNFRVRPQGVENDQCLEESMERVEVQDKFLEVEDEPAALTDVDGAAEGSHSSHTTKLYFAIIHLLLLLASAVCMLPVAALLASSWGSTSCVSTLVDKCNVDLSGWFHAAAMLIEPTPCGLPPT